MKKVKSPPFPTPWLTQEGLYNAHLLWTEVAMVLAVSQGYQGIEQTSGFLYLTHHPSVKN